MANKTTKSQYPISINVRINQKMADFLGKKNRSMKVRRLILASMKKDEGFLDYLGKAKVWDRGGFENESERHALKMGISCRYTSSLMADCPGSGSSSSMSIVSPPPTTFKPVNFCRSLKVSW